MQPRDRSRGILLGLACGDAVGRPVEGMPRSRIEREYGRLTQMRGDGVHRLPPGSITDDTELALCLARSLVACDGFEADDLAQKFATWFQGDPTGIGGMTRRVLSRVATGEPWQTASKQVWKRSPEGQNAGNGSLMRVAPLAARYAHEAERLVETSMESSRITHWDPRCTHGCAALNFVITGFLDDVSDPVSLAFDRLDADAPDEVRIALREATDVPEPSMLPITGYVIDTLEAGIGHALLAESAEEAIVTAVNNGGDTDTIGAVAGAVAGARFGASALPDRWLDELVVRVELESLADELFEDREAEK